MKRAPLCIAALTGALLFVGTATAQSKKMANIAVYTNSEPASSIGFVISQRGTAQKLKTIVEPTGAEGLFQAAFPYTKDDYAGDAVSTALVINSDGSVAYGDMVSLREGAPGSVLLDIPACSDIDHARVNEIMSTGQHSLIQSLVRIREERRELLKSQVASKLQGPFLIRLRKLEAGFGLNHNSSISPEMSAMELNDRLTRLIHAIKTYQTHQAYRKRGQEREVH
jgi:hypothetical protein